MVRSTLDAIIWCTTHAICGIKMKSDAFLSFLSLSLTITLTASRSIRNLPNQSDVLKLIQFDLHSFDGLKHSFNHWRYRFNNSMEHTHTYIYLELHMHNQFEQQRMNSKHNEHIKWFDALCTVNIIAIRMSKWMLTTSRQLVALFAVAIFIFRAHRLVVIWSTVEYRSSEIRQLWRSKNISNSCGIKSARIETYGSCMARKSIFLETKYVYYNRNIRASVHRTFIGRHARAHVIRHDFNFEH